MTRVRKTPDNRNHTAFLVSPAPVEQRGDSKKLQKGLFLHLPESESESGQSVGQRTDYPHPASVEVLGHSQEAEGLPLTFWGLAA